MSLDLFLVLFGFSTSLLIDNARGLESEGILGGTEASPGDYGYQVFLLVGEKNLCGGSIYKEQFVISAAHCFIDDTSDSFTEDNITVVAGVINTNNINDTNRVAAAVQKIYIPKEFDGTIDEDIMDNLNDAKDMRHTTGDIAVLKLNQTLEIKSPYVEEIKLDDGNTNYDGKEVKAIVTGNGWIEVTNTTSSAEQGKSDNKLRFLETEILNQAVCENLYDVVKISKSHICAKAINKDGGTCNGDSGGPLVYNNTLIGVVSKSPRGCSENNLPTIYTRVSSYLDFINDATEDIEGPTMDVCDLTSKNCIRKKDQHD